MLSGSILSILIGGVGGICSSILGYFDKQRADKHELALAAARRTELAMMANIDQAKLAGALAQLREQGANAAWVKSYDADMASPGDSRLVKDFKAVIRPGLTTAYFAMTFLLLIGSILAWRFQWATESVTTPIIIAVIDSILSLNNLTTSWYFGQRSVDRAITYWGNRTAGGGVGTVGSNKKPTPLAQ